MDFAIEIVLRLMHILAAITAVGGLFFMRLALLPTVSELPEDARAQLHAGVRARWSKVVMVCIAFLLISGIFNLIRTLGDDTIELAPAYHALFGIKFLLALAIFFISSLLTGRSGLAERIRQNVKFWLTLNLVLAIVLVVISGVLRSSKTPKPVGDTSSSVIAPDLSPLAIKI